MRTHCLPGYTRLSRGGGSPAGEFIDECDFPTLGIPTIMVLIGLLILPFSRVFKFCRMIFSVCFQSGMPSPVTNWSDHLNARLVEPILPKLVSTARSLYSK